jgi:histidyl-tRNA synthetase
MSKYQAIRGTKDILPAAAKQFQILEQIARDVFERFGFFEIRTPTFEALDLFQRSLGETTDVVQKEMYAFEDRGGRKLALRPEGTAGVVRAFVEHHLSQTQPFCKLLYIGPMFRAERPQAGRYREFWQIGAESFGNPAPTADAELLLLVQTLFDRVGVGETQLKINSLGCDDCRPKYLEALSAYIQSKLSSLCEDCQRRAEKNPLRVLDCKTDQEKLADAPTIDKFWDDGCRTHFETVQELLRRAGGRFVLTPRLVRGLDYYTRTVFELTTNALGAQDALAAGGRYDKLVKDIGGPDTPALGFALGAERALLAREAATKTSPAPTSIPLLFVAAAGDAASTAAFELLQSLRLNAELAAKGIRSEGGFFTKKLGAQITIADRIGATHVIILGEDELARGQITLKSLRTGTQETLAKDALVPHLWGLNGKDKVGQL